MLLVKLVLSDSVHSAAILNADKGNDIFKKSLDGEVTGKSQD